MEKVYWLGRKRASLKMAKSAVGCEARRAHSELADRYGARATSAETQATDLANALPRPINRGRASSADDGNDDA